MRHFGPIQSKEASDSLLLKNKTHRYNFEREKFCNFIFSHETPFRNWFFSQLSKYKKIDAPGRAMNNCPPIEPIPEGAVRNAHFFSGSWIEDKIAYQQNYKFAIAFENATNPGYTTEKIHHAMEAGCIPIYWGDPLIHHEFNEKSFVNFHRYERIASFLLPGCSKRLHDSNRPVDRLGRFLATRLTIRRVVELDRSPKKYRQCLNQPWYVNDTPLYESRKLLIQNRLNTIATEAIQRRQAQTR
jgi:hypothetical protein